MTIERDGQKPDSYQGINPVQNPPTQKAVRDPTTLDRRYKIGTIWINTATNASFQLTSVAAGVANWITLGSGTGAVATLSDTSGTQTSPTAGNIQINGTADEIDVTAGVSELTLSIPATFTAPGSITATLGDITATDGDIIATDGNIVLEGAASQLQIEGGAVTDFIGQATLVAGTVTVANTNIAATDKIFLSREGVGASTALGVLNVSITPGTSFTITSLDAGTPANTETGDISTINYFIVRQL
jgi:hypothetical protein